MLRVLQVCASVARSDGGPSTAILELNAALNRRPDVTSRIMATDADGRGRLSAAEKAAVLERVEYNVTLFHSHRPRSLKPSWRMAVALRAGVRDVDVVHIHGLHLFHTAVAAVVARRCGIPYVLQPHGGMEPYQRSRHRRRKWWFDHTVGRRCLEDAAAIVFADESEAQAAADVVVGARGHVVPLGARLAEIEPGGPVSPALQSLLSSAGRTVLFLGRLAPKKRVDLLIAAFSSLAEKHVDLHLVVVGEGERDYEATLREQAHHSRVSTRIHFVGPLYDAEKSLILRHASLFVLPSENENFAISVAEALVAGVPVVTTRQVAMHKRVIAHRAGVVIDSPDVIELERAMQLVLADASFHTGARTAGQHLSFDDTAETAVAMYRAVVAKQPA